MDYHNPSLAFMIRLGQSEGNWVKIFFKNVESETFTKLKVTIFGIQIKTFPTLLTWIPIFTVGSFDEFQMS